MREWRRAVVAVVGLAFAADRRRAWFAVVAWPICGVLGTFSSLWLKLLVDGAAGGDRRQVLVAAGLVAVSASVALSGFFISLTAMTRVREEVDREIDKRLIALTGGVLGVAHQENPEYLDRLELLRTGRGELADVVSALSSFLLFALRILVTSALLVSVFPGLLVLPLFALPSLVLTGRAQRFIQHAEERTAADQRRALHLFDLATGPSPAKELRIFGLESTIAQRHRDLRRAVDRKIAKARTAAASSSAPAPSWPSDLPSGKRPPGGPRPATWSSRSQPPPGCAIRLEGWRGPSARWLRARRRWAGTCGSSTTPRSSAATRRHPGAVRPCWRQIVWPTASGSREWGSATAPTSRPRSETSTSTYVPAALWRWSVRTGPGSPRW